MDTDHKQRLVTSSNELLELEDEDKLRRKRIESLVVTRKGKKGLIAPRTEKVESTVLSKARAFLDTIRADLTVPQDSDKIDLIGPEEDSQLEHGPVVEMNLMLFEQKIKDSDSDSDSDSVLSFDSKRHSSSASSSSSDSDQEVDVIGVADKKADIQNGSQL